MSDSNDKLIEENSLKDASYYEQPRLEMLKFIPEGVSSVLDVGCGSGQFGKLIKESRQGCLVWGIEPNNEFAIKASDNLDHVISDKFGRDNEQLQGHRFDVICLNDVLEHMADPERTLIGCKSFLTPNGIVVASIPNVLYFYNIIWILIKQDWKYEDAGIMDNTHLRFFTKKSIIRLFEECGYVIVNLEGINESYGPKYRILNFLTFGWITDWRYIQFAIQARPAE